MSNKHRYKRKVVIVGAGAVGATFCYALAQSGLADEIAMIDRNENMLKGQVLDLVHGQPFFPMVTIQEGHAEDYADAQLIVITAGTAQKPGESRLQLLQRNAHVVRSIMNDIIEQQSSSVVLMVCNPVDIMTRVALDCSGWPAHRIFGSGTVLDSARLRHLISSHCKVDVHNVHAYVLGEHGDSEFAAWSMAHIAGVPFEQYCRMCNGCHDSKVMRADLEQQVRDSAYHIIGYKGATCFAVGLALTRITGAILREQYSVLAVSTLLTNEYGLQDVCLSVPCIVSSKGIERIITNQLPVGEMESLEQSAATLKASYRSLNADHLSEL